MIDIDQFLCRRLHPCAHINGVQLFSLQKKHGASQLADVADRMTIHDLGPQLDNQTGAFMDTAAVMRNLDLVITSDTAIAHLAGALGVKVWLATAMMPDWRWFLNRENSPWYPTMQLFRQTSIGDWESVFDRMEAKLWELVGS